MNTSCKTPLNNICKVFVYDELLDAELCKRLGINPIKKELAETIGKMFLINKTPIVLRPNEGVQDRGHNKILGVIYTFDNSQDVLQKLDNYSGCSLSRTGFITPNDIKIRLQTIVYPIEFNSIQELEEYRYIHLKPEQCYMYVGNIQNDNVRTKLKRHRISDGVYKEGFKKLLKEIGYNA